MKAVGILLLGAAAVAVAASFLRTNASLESDHRQWGAKDHEPPAPCRRIRALGYIEPVSEVRRLVFKRDGVVAKCCVNCGDRVGEGDLLMTLTSDLEKVRLAVAQRELELARAEREQLRAGINEHRIAAAERKVEDSAGFERHANRRLARISALNGKGAVTDAERDSAEYDAAHGRAALGQAKAELDELRHFVRPVDSASADAKVSLAEARVAEINAELETTFLRAPFDGTVLELLRREGEAARSSDGTAVIVFADESQIHVRAEVDDRCVHELREGQHAVITGRALGGESFAGKIAMVKRLMGRKTVFARTSSERKDVGVIEVIIDAPPAFSAPIGLQVDVAIQRPSGELVGQKAEERAHTARNVNARQGANRADVTDSLGTASIEPSNFPGVTGN